MYLKPIYCYCFTAAFHFYLYLTLCFITGSNGQVMYGGVTEEGFIINPVTGVITTTKELDTELQSHYTLTGTKIFTVLQNSYIIELNLIYFHTAPQVQYISLKFCMGSKISLTIPIYYQCMPGMEGCLLTLPRL